MSIPTRGWELFGLLRIIQFCVRVSLSFPFASVQISVCRVRGNNHRSLSWASRAH